MSSLHLHNIILPGFTFFTRYTQSHTERVGSHAHAQSRPSSRDPSVRTLEQSTLNSVYGTSAECLESHNQLMLCPRGRVRHCRRPCHEGAPRSTFLQIQAVPGKIDTRLLDGTTSSSSNRLSFPARHGIQASEGKKRVEGYVHARRVY